MAVATYTTDLTIFNNCTSTTGWSEMQGMDRGGGPDNDTDLGIYGSECISQLIRKTGLGSLAYNNGSGVTIPSNGGFFVWNKYFAPNGVETLANGGVGVVIGSSTTNWGNFNLDGSDTYPYGGWTNYFVDPTLTPDSTNGTYNTTYQYCGTSINVTIAVSKGNPHTVDILRYGRGESRFTNGQAGSYATFAGFATFNDNATAGRYGLIQDVGGSYLWKGLMSLGLSGTSVDMRDSNVNIAIDNTLKASAGFNRIEVHNASSNIEWTSVNITKVGTVSRGEFEMIDNAVVKLNTCVFSDMSTFIFKSNALNTNTSFIRTDKITAGSATFDSCTFDENRNTTSVLATDLADFTDCNFISDGSNHAIELSTVGDGTMDWDNYLESYVAGTAASPVTPTSTGNEAIYVNVGSGTLTINVGSGYAIPSIRSAGATVNVVSGQVTTTINVTTRTGVDIQNARVYMEAAAGGPITTGTVIFNDLTDVNGEVSDTRSLTSSQPVSGRVRKSTSAPLYSTSPFSGTISNTSGMNLTILMISDE